MTMQDPIADMLTRIRNAQAAHHPSVSVPSSKLVLIERTAGSGSRCSSSSAEYFSIVSTAMRSR